MINNSERYKTDLQTRCYKLSLNVIALTDTLPNKRASWVISDQLIRSTTSIGANLIEATASSSRLEFKKFHEIALKSANESIYWLCLLKDSKLADAQEVIILVNETKEIANMLGKSVLRLKNKIT